MKIIWLASYPKSGNTLMRMILYSYMHDASFEKTGEIEDRIPDLHKLLSTGKALDLGVDANVLVKSHFKYSDQHPYIANTEGFIYILRNPRDVLLSNARYHGLHCGDDLMKEFALTFINNMGVPRWKEMNMGSWPEHVGSWLTAMERFPGIFVKYEELREKPEIVLEKVIRFLFSRPDQEKIRESVKAAAINYARELERNEKNRGEVGIFDELPNGEPFVGEGRINQSLVRLGDDIEDLYVSRFGRCTGLLGYE